MYDVGQQYRSVIFYHNEEQRKVAENLKSRLEKTEYKNPIVTQIVPFKQFYRAEGYHQNFYNQNQNHPYCQIIINPKIQKLIRLFGKDLKA